MATAKKPEVNAMRELGRSGSASPDLGSSSSYSNGTANSWAPKKRPCMGSKLGRLRWRRFPREQRLSGGQSVLRVRGTLDRVLRLASCRSHPQ